MSPSTPNRSLVILSFLAIYIIWGSTYLLNKIVVGELEPFFIAGVRFSSAGIIIFIIARVLGFPLSISKKQIVNCTIAGFLFLTIGNGLAVWALKFLDSGFVALQISAQPLVVLILMYLIQGKKIRAESMLGIALGMVGIYLLVSQDSLISNQQSIIGMLMILVCMITWGYGSLFVADADLPSNFFINTGYQMLFGGITLFGCSLLFGEQWIGPALWSNATSISMILLIIFGSIVAFTSFNYLLKYISPEKVATSAYINPIVALALGWYILDETITSRSVLAAIILLSGVYFINKSKEEI